MPTRASDPTDRAVVLHEQGLALREAGQPAKARRRLGRAIAIFERHDGPRSPDVANVLLELAAVSHDEGAYADGIASVERALAILGPLRGGTDFDRLRVQAYRRLGSLHVDLGEYSVARRACLRALKIAETKLSSHEVASALNDLGVVCKYSSRFLEAARLYRRALSLSARVEGSTSLAVASILHNLGGLEHSRGRYKRAEHYARQSVAIRRRRLGAGHPDVAADKAALAAVLHGLAGEARERAIALRHVREAERLYRDALQVFTRTLGPRHFEVGFNLGQLAALLQISDRLPEASRLYRRALRILEETLGAGHPQLAITWANVAALRSAEGRTKDAVLAYDRALTIARKAWGPRHADTRELASQRRELAP